MSTYFNLPKLILNASENSLEDLQSENLQLIRQIRKLEGEHLTTKAVLGQRIEILEDQIAGFQEREDNINRINKSIMDALEDLNNKEGKNEFTAKAAEELRRASQQYTQAIIELKKKSKDELGKFEDENKALKEQLIEKDYQIKALQLIIEEMKSSYANVKDFILKNGTPIQTEEIGSQFKDKAIPVPDDQKQKETFGRITKVERNLEQIRETIKERTVKIGETTLETERSGNSISPINSESTFLTRTTSINQFIPSTNITRIVSENERRSLLGGEAQPLKLNHVNSESAISTRSDFLTRGTYQSSDKHLLPVISEPILSEGVTTPQRDIEKENVHRLYPSVSNSTLEKSAYNQNIDYKNQHYNSATTYYGTPNKRYYQEERQLNTMQRYPNSNGFINNHKSHSECSSKAYVPILPLQRTESGVLHHNKENFDEPDFGRSMIGYNTERVTVTTVSDFQEKLWDKNQYDDSGLKTEIKYMIGRLLKVKNKLEKQTEQISMSRSPNRNHSREYVSVKNLFKRKESPKEMEKFNKGMKRVESIPSWTSNRDKNFRDERNHHQVNDHIVNVSNFESKPNYGRYY